FRVPSWYASVFRRRQPGLRRPARSAVIQPRSSRHSGRSTIPLAPQPSVNDAAMAPRRQNAPSGRHLSLAHPAHGDNAPQPIRTLRDWLDRLAAQDRLAIAKAGVDLRFELAAIAKRLDGRRATLFPRPGHHGIPVVSGLVSDRNWIADAMGVEPSELLEK